MAATANIHKTMEIKVITNALSSTWRLSTNLTLLYFYIYLNWRYLYEEYFKSQQLLIVQLKRKQKGPILKIKCKRERRKERFLLLKSILPISTPCKLQIHGRKTYWNYQHGHMSNKQILKEKYVQGKSKTEKEYFCTN